MMKLLAGNGNGNNRTIKMMSLEFDVQSVQENLLDKFNITLHAVHDELGIKDLFIGKEYYFTYNGNESGEYEHFEPKDNYPSLFDFTSEYRYYTDDNGEEESILMEEYFFLIDGKKIKFDYFDGEEVVHEQIYMGFEDVIKIINHIYNNVGGI